MKGRIFGLILLIGAACVSSVDAQPDSLWSRTYGGTANDTLAGLIPTADGGYLLCGYFTLLYETDIDGYLLKLDSQFNRQWEDYFGGRQAQIIRDIHQLPDGGYIAAGYTESDPIDNVRRAWVRRLDDEGRGVWTEYLGRTNYSDAFSVVPNPDGTFVVGGTFYPGNGWQDDFALWKLNAQGGQVWRRHFGDSAAGEFGLSLVRCEDGGYALGGQRLVWGESGVEDGSAMFLRADNDGEQLWRNNYGDRDGIEFFIRVIITSDGGFLCVGGYGDKSGGQGIHNFDGFLVKADADGRQQWAQRLDLGGRWEFVFDVLEVNDGYVVTGVTGSPSENNWEGLDSCDAYLLRTDLRGNIRWQRIFAGPGHDYGYRILPTADGGYLIGGVTSSIGEGGADLWLLKTGRDPLTSVVETSLLLPQDVRIAAVYPNPFNGQVVICLNRLLNANRNLQILSFEGRILLDARMNSQTSGCSFVWDAAGLPAGIYYARIQGKAGTVDKKSLILLK